jgi:hypothetical protein
MINYIKPNNEELFISMEQLNFTKIQNYIPLYNEFFMLNKTNFNAIQLKNDWILKSVDAKINDELHGYTATIKHITSSTIQKADIFIKEAPLLDPFKFITGKYKNNLECIKNLPSFTYNAVEQTDKNHIIPKVLNPQNASYVDGLFNYLNGCLQNDGFVHGISFYGSYLSVKKQYSFNIADDFEYLMHSSYFKKNNGVLFTIPSNYTTNNSLNISDTNMDNITLDTDITLDDLIDCPSNMEPNDLSLNPNELATDADSSLSLIEQYTNKTHTMSEYSSTCSNPDDTQLDELIYPVSYLNTFTPYLKSDACKNANNKETGSSHTDRTHLTNDDSSENDSEEYLDDSGEDDDNNSWSTVDSKHKSSDNSSNYDDDDYDTDSYDTDIDEYIGAIIPEFPVHLICIEKCKNTLDSLLIHNTLSENELFSCIMQIIMILITYQEGFKFTHNDLHTNNIVYTETSKKYLLYTYNNQQYWVPTYGKIYKIIDFGRSIYTVNNVLICGDSYQKHEDAYSQYNFGPCLQPNKPVVEPNYSFDLCRLACSMIDIFIDSYDPETLADLTPFSKLLLHLCLDDNGYHILYKNNREERYPNFTLYKMIARTVHLHTPQNILKLECFELYKHFNQSLLSDNSDYIFMDIARLIVSIKNSEDL